MNVITKKILVTDDNKKFDIGMDMAFEKLNKDTNQFERYIVKIEDIIDDLVNPEYGYIKASHVEINRQKEDTDGIYKFRFCDMKNCNYVYCD